MVFGFISSAFILHYAIKKNVFGMPGDECTELLRNNLCVDNFFKTVNDTDELRQTYSQAYSRMAEVGIVLRSWTSNNSEFAELF